MSCPFSSPKLHDDRQEITWENDLYLLIQQEHPVLITSGCIIPKDHHEMPFDLTRKAWNSSHDLLRTVKTLLDERHSPDGYTIGGTAARAAAKPYSKCICTLSLASPTSPIQAKASAIG